MQTLCRKLDEQIYRNNVRALDIRLGVVYRERMFS